ncbi:MAG TPA: amino acid adenylation domain-containing protein [Duganella sp.]|nr:amino acid adenylation domain-containing protein [Duganella sp.]
MNDRELFSLTLTQRDIFLHQIQHPSSPFYNVGGYIRFGAIDIAKLTLAHQRLVTSHDAFGIRISGDKGEPMQWISRQRTQALPHVDFSDNDDAPRIAGEWIAELFQTPVPAEDAELFRAFLVTISPSEHWYVGLAHHISMDGWGFANWARMLGTYYDDIASDPAQTHSWRSVSESDGHYLAGPRRERDRAYWVATLSRMPERLFPGKPTADSGGPSQRSVRRLSKDQSANVKAMAEKLGVGPQQVWSALLAVYVYGVYDRSHFIIGSPTHNRSAHAQKEMIGVFASMSPLVVTLAPEDSFAALVAAVARRQKDMLRHQRYPLGFIVRDLGLQGGRGSLFDVALNFLKLDSHLDTGDGAAQLEYVSNQHEITPLALTIWEYGTEQPPQLQIDYNLAYFDTAEIVLVQERLSYLLDQLPELAHKSIVAIDVLPPGERARLVHGLDADPTPPRENTCIHDLFEAQVRLSPDATAVLSGRDSLTYRELDERANRLAHLLRERGVGPEFLVGLCVDRSLEMLVGVLAILKAGGAYVPLDPAYPDERLHYMRKDSGVGIVLTQSVMVDRPWLDGAEVICVDEEMFADRVSREAPARANLNADNLAYVIYTSGSTGQPKGVAITHANTVALLQWALEAYTPAQLRTVLASTSLNFDLSVFELFLPLSAGHTCVIVRDALVLLDSKIDVSLINTVPSAMKVLLEQNAIPASVQVINLAGEPLTRSLLNALLEKDPGRPIFNLYGPTEDTTYSTFVEFRAPVEGVPGIGAALPGSQAYVMSTRETLLPVGSVGQLYLGGRGVARGYLGRPGLTAERFVPDPFYPLPGRRLYKTGDLVRQLGDGSLEFIGRIDQQVKIRGHRIELGEVENQLGRLAPVREAIVIASGEHEQRKLVAYLVADPAERATLGDSGLVREVRRQLSNLLAEYMLPAHYVVIDAMPLTPNGKIDRSALSAYDSPEDEYLAPSTPTERALASVWQTILKIERVSANANFFEIGGDSLRMVQAIHAARTTCGMQLSMRDLLGAPTIVELAHAVDMQQTTQSNGPMPGAGGNDQSLSPAQQRIWVHEQFHGAGLNNIVGVVELDQPYAPDALQAGLQRIIDLHDVLRTRMVDSERGMRQVVEADIEPDFECHDLRNSAAPEADMAQLLLQHASRPFDLAQPSLFATLVLYLPAGRTVMQLKLHHMVADGWSVIVLFDHLMAILNREEASVPAAAGRLSYRDYVVWQTAFLQSASGMAQRAFWRDYLHDVSPGLVLPFQASRPLATAIAAPLVVRTLDIPLRVRLHALARRNRGTLFNVLHAALALLLSRVGDAPDLIIGIPVSGRHVSGTEDLVGMFVNNLPLRSRVDLAVTFDTFLRQQIANVETVLSHPDLPFETIVELSGIQRQADSAPLVQVFFNMLSLPESRSGRQLLHEAFAKVDAIRHKFNLSLYVADGADGTNFYVSYNPTILSRETIETLMEQYLYLLTQLAHDQHRECGKYSLRPVKEAQVAPLSANTGAAGLPDPRAPISTGWCGPVQTLFERQALAAPERIALTYGGRQMTYGTLRAWSGYYANQLRAAGIGRGDIVAILTERCDALVVATLAVMQAGAAFMMLSQKVPVRRLCEQVAAVPPRCLIRLSPAPLPPALAESLAAIDCHQLIVDVSGKVGAAGHGEIAESHADDLAYISFTSGTEGRAKAVRGKHSALTAYHPWTVESFNLLAEDRFGMFSGLVHDPLQRDMFTPLCIGATLCIPHEGELEGTQMEQWLSEQRPTVLNLTPSMARVLVQACREPLPSLRRIFLGGERITAAIVRELGQAAPHAALIGLYGTTETVRALAWQALGTAPTIQADDALPVGRGVGDVQMLVLNAQMTPCGIGEPGQIAIRSPHLALGYHDDPILTARKFIVNPATGEAHDMVYLTGDKGRYRDDGTLECLGRLDQQIKIRGFRVDPAEIEVCLATHPDVRQAVVTGVPTATADIVLVAYLVPWPHRPLSSDRDLAAYLASRLPDYMVPSHWVEISAIPLNENGKLDRKHLPRPKLFRDKETINVPAGPHEEKLLRLWQSVFARDDIGVDQDFFALGGNSLLAAQLLIRIERECGVKPSYQEFFASSSIRSIASRIGHIPPAPAADPVVKRRRQLIL